MILSTKQWIRLIWLLNLGLIVGIGYVVRAHLAVEEAGPAVTLQQAIRPVGTINAISEAGNEVVGRSDPRTILDGNLFGMGQVQKRNPDLQVLAQQKQVASQEIPPLDYRLLGTVAGDPTVSFAVIQHTKTNEQNIFKMGQTIEEMRLVKIQQNRIVVSYCGEFRSLEVTLSDGKASAPAPTQVRAPVNRGQLQRVLMATSEDEVLVNTLASSESMHDLGRDLEKVSYRLNQESTPGIKLTGISKLPLARMVGLRDGDIIQSINGRTLTNRRKAAQVMRKARQLGQAELSIAQGDRQKKLSIRPGIW